MSNFLIFKAAFNNSATPAVGTYTAEGATARFNVNASLSPDYYMYAATAENPIKWFVPTAVVTDFEFVCDILTRTSNAGYAPYFTIADSNGVTKLRMESQYSNIRFMSDDTHGQSSSVICLTSPTNIGGYNIFHQFRIRIRKLTDSSSSVEVYANDNLVTSGTSPALITCGKISFLGATGAFVTGNTMGVKNAYVYDLSGGEVIDRGVLSGAFNRFINWMKSVFALKSDIPTVNNGTLTIKVNGATAGTFTANQSTAATANITVPTAVSELTNDSGYLTSSSNLDASKLTSGTVDIARLPQGALERLVKVANEAARYALTIADVQLGDTVQQLDTGIMYVVTDTDHLDSAAGYTEYTAGTAASVPWSGVTGKPTFAAVATSGAYSDLTGTPTIPTVNNATLTIQQNGANVQTFTANASTNATANIQCVDLTSAQTIAGDKDFTGTTGTHDVIPATTDTYDLGSSAKEYKNAYIKALTVNGAAAGDILTHNASEFVPVSGGAVLTGQIFARTNTTSFTSLCGGTAASSNGGEIDLYGVDSAANAGAVVMRTYPSGNTIYFNDAGLWCVNELQLGRSGRLWGQIYSTNSTISTSDSRLKNSIKDIDDKLLDAWENIEPKQYKFNDATEKKGEKARYHTGYLAQDVQAECEKLGVNASDYGLFCYDEWEEQEEVSEEIETEKDGKIVKEKRIIQPKREKGNSYALRYEEALVVECKYLRRCIERLEARLAQLENPEESQEKGADK